MNLLYSSLTIGITIVALIFGLSLMPDASQYPMPTGITSAISSLVGYINAWSYFIDVKTLFIVLISIMSTELAIWFFNIISWVYRMFLKGGAN